MPPANQHEVVRDCTLTFAHVLRTHLPPGLEGRPVDIVFDVPDVKRIEKARNENKALLSVILIDCTRSQVQQSAEQPIVRDEDEEGNVAEFRMGPPTFVEVRYLITVWTGDPLFDQVVMGLVMSVFFTRGTFSPQDIQGRSIYGDHMPMIRLVESFNLDKQMKLWQCMGHPYRPGLVYGITLRMDSMAKTLVRRVKERVLDYRKLEG